MKPEKTFIKLRNARHFTALSSAKWFATATISKSTKAVAIKTQWILENRGADDPMAFAMLLKELT